MPFLHFLWCVMGNWFLKSEQTRIELVGSIANARDAYETKRFVHWKFQLRELQQPLPLFLRQR